MIEGKPNFNLGTVIAKGGGEAGIGTAKSVAAEKRRASAWLEKRTTLVDHEAQPFRSGKEALAPLRKQDAG